MSYKHMNTELLTSIHFEQRRSADSAVSSLMEFSVSGEIRNFAVGNGKVFVVTDSQLLQMRLDRVEEKHKDIQNHTHQNQVNILLPFHANKTLITWLWIP
ncbi:hypothetical protein AOLI_G00323840 [Acnodon oligacanthus]